MSKKSPSKTKQSKSVFFCTECGNEYSKWQGQCTGCGAWNTIKEMTVAKSSADKRSGYAGKKNKAPTVSRLNEVAVATQTRMASGMAELDRVLGGGLVQGSIVLVGGDPGIGKSTLLLQTAATLAQQCACLYVSGEESLSQIAQRAQRLNLPSDDIQGLSETCVERILETVVAHQSAVLIIDSIQTLWSESLSAAPGSVSQVRECAAQLTRYAKQTNTSVFLIGHVTKDGGIAGPRVLEHMVDAVLYFESEAGSRFRILRAIKNRFGAVNELGVFAMANNGLREVPNPSAIFLSGANEPTPGSAVMVTREGTRPLMVEVQALVDHSPLANPRRLALGLEQNRLAMLLAVLNRHAGIAAYDQDVFINIVGGIRIQETAADLPLLLAVVSSLRAQPLPEHTIAFAEVGLSGELRPVAYGEDRLREAATHGYKRAIVSAKNAPKSKKVGDMSVFACQTIAEAIDMAWDG